MHVLQLTKCVIKLEILPFYLFFRPENLTVPYVGTVSIGKTLIDPVISTVAPDGDGEYARHDRSELDSASGATT